MREYLAEEIATDFADAFLTRREALRRLALVGLSTSAAVALLAARAAAPADRLVADLRAGVDELERRAPRFKLAAVGFCFGGGLTWQLLAAGEPRLAAAVPFYGPAPENPDFSRSKAAVLGIYAELDARVNAP